jgi:galactose mutarotase-like enzyme
MNWNRSFPVFTAGKSDFTAADRGKNSYMIQETVFKGFKAICLENESLRVVILPSEGARLASVYRKDREFELLFQGDGARAGSGRDAIPPGEKKFEATGFDDCFPTIHACEVSVDGRQVRYPDHGETWRLAFDCRTEGEQAVLECKSGILPYRFRKTVALEGDRILIRYSIANIGGFDFPCIWAMHCLINCEEDIRLAFPAGTEEVLNVLENEFLGKAGTIHSFPVTHTPDGSEFRLDRVLPAASKNCNKYYVKGMVGEGRCGAYYPSKNISFTVRFDHKKLPYLGFWVTEGALGGDYNCALEPTNGYYDDINTARRENGLYTLKKGEVLEFEIEMELA